MKVIFLGSGEFSQKCLKHLYESKHKIIACICSPDKKGNRGVVTPCAVKQFALQNSIEVLQIEKFADQEIQRLKELNADIMITAAYGQILPREVLSICKHGIVNVHGSLLPKYRGAAPIQWALINGEKTTGISIMRTVWEMDAGDVILQKGIDLQPSDDAVVLFDKLAILGGEALLEAIEQLDNGTAVFTKQDNDKATYCKKITNQTGIINWQKSATEIANLIKGLTFNGAAVTKIGEQMVKIWAAEVLDENFDTIAGTVVQCNKKGIVVSAAIGSIKLLTLQFPNNKKISGTDAANGGKIQVGCILGG